MSKVAYEMFLRIAGLSVAAVLLFESGVISPVTHQISKNAANYVANSVGVTVGVEPTELNQITAALTERETALDMREKALNEREIAVNVRPEQGVGVDTSTFILSALLFIILVLIVLNYVLDYMRYRESVDGLQTN